MSTVQKWFAKAAVKDRYNIGSDRQLADMQAKGLPKPHYFGPRSPRWNLDQLEEFDRRVLAGEIQLANPDAIVAQTVAARGSYMAKVATGEIGASRRATAARKRQVAA